MYFPKAALYERKQALIGLVNHICFLLYILHNHHYMYLQRTPPPPQITTDTLCHTLVWLTNEFHVQMENRSYIKLVISISYGMTNYEICFARARFTSIENLSHFHGTGTSILSWMHAKRTQDDGRRKRIVATHNVVTLQNVVITTFCLAIALTSIGKM